MVSIFIHSFLFISILSAQIRTAEIYLLRTQLSTRSKLPIQILLHVTQKSSETYHVIGRYIFNYLVTI